MMYLLYLSRLYLFIIGFIGFFVSQRFLVNQTSVKVTVIVSFVLMLLSVIISFVVFKDIKKHGKKEEYKSVRALILSQFSLIISDVLYLVYSYVLETFNNNFNICNKILLGAWILSLILGIFFTIGVEWAIKGSSLYFKDRSNSRFFDYSRVKRSCVYLGSIGLVLCISILLCYISFEKNKSMDLSYLKIATPSETVVSYLNNNDLESKDLRIEVYYPKDNEVRPFIEKYFNILKSKYSSLNVKYIDLDTSPMSASLRDIFNNGYVVLVVKDKDLDDKIEKIYVGLDLKEARSVIKDFDSKFQTSLIKLTSDPKVIYLTSSHLEIDVNKEDKDPFRSYTLFSKIISSLNYKVKNLSTSSLIEKVPSDARCVFVLSSESSFLDQEVKSLDDYLNKGGCLFYVLDVGKRSSDAAKVVKSSKDSLQKYFESKGLIYHKDLLANMSNNVRVFKTDVDSLFIFSNEYSRHESMKNLRSIRKKMFTLFFRTGYFSYSPFKDGWNFSEIISSLPETFIDSNKNYKLDKVEQPSMKDTYILAVVGKKNIVDNKGTEDQNSDKDKEQNKDINKSQKESRVVVLPTSTMISDALLENVANSLFVMESLRWSLSEKDIVSSLSSEEDVKIQHTKSENIIWFNTTVVIIPIIILIIGFFVLRSMKKKD